MIAEAERLKARLLGMVDGYLTLTECGTSMMAAELNNEFEGFAETLTEFTDAVIDAAKHGAA
jgi:hypothetical protein